MKICKLCKNSYSIPYGFTDENICLTCYDLRQAQGKE